ncbi:MAG: J domain-containing protein [Chloroflexota bacterium]
MRVEDLLATLQSGADPLTLLNALTREALKTCHAEIHRMLGTESEGGNAQGSSGPYQVLHLSPSAPDDVVKIVYRHLSKKHHPDAGGSSEAMARLNGAYEEIARERGWKT